MVSIEQSDCTSCGQCPDISPAHFFMGHDGYAYVKGAKESDRSAISVVGFSGRVSVTAESEADVIEAAEYCPGECIYVTVDSPF